MMAAKVGTGLVAELGAMRINEEIDAMEVMGIPSITFLCTARLLAAWMVLSRHDVDLRCAAKLGQRSLAQSTAHDRLDQAPRRRNLAADEDACRI